MPEETDRLHTASRDVLALLQRTAAQIARSTKNPDVRLAAAQEEKKLADRLAEASARTWSTPAADPRGAWLEDGVMSFKASTATGWFQGFNHAKIAEGVADGTFLVSGPQVPRTGGAILATGTSRTQIEELVETDPLVREGAASYEVVEFLPTRGPYAR